MTPSFAVKQGVRYRYYVSRATTEGRSGEAGSVNRVPAPEIERAVLDALAGHFLGNNASGPAEISARRSNDPGSVDRGDGVARRNSGNARVDAYALDAGARDALGDPRRLLEEMVDRVTIETGVLQIALTPAAAAIAQGSQIIVPWSKSPTRVRRELLPPTDGSRDDRRAMTSETRSSLLVVIAKARAYLDDLVAGRILDIAKIALREKRSARSALMLLSFAFLAPDLVRAIAESRLPKGIRLTRLMELPGDWAEQHRALGLS